MGLSSMPMHTKPTRARVRRIRDRLREVYGIPAAPPHGRGLDELILTVLSQSTNDRNRDVAFLRLRRRFGDLGGGARRPQRGGRGGDPARRHLQGQVAADPGDPARAAGRRSTVARTVADREFLLSLPGVGRKTAACVLLFAYGKRDIPVDTHVSRVGARLGLFRAGAPFEEMHDDMLAFTPRGQELEFHVNLLRHGRRTCHARRPDCDGCALLRMCPTGYDLRHLD